MTVYILGAGPAGLSLAYYLSKINISVEVFESTDCLGGWRASIWNDFHVETDLIFTYPTKRNMMIEIILETILYKKSFFTTFAKVNSEFLFDYPLNKAQVYNSDYWSDNQASQIVMIWLRFLILMPYHRQLLLMNMFKGLLVLYFHHPFIKTIQRRSGYPITRCYLIGAQAFANL